MAAGKGQRWGLIASVVLAVLIVGGIVGFRVAVGVLKRTVTLRRITLRDGVLEFFGATVTQPPLKIRLEQVQATVRDVVVPALTGKDPVGPCRRAEGCPAGWRRARGRGGGRA